MVQSALRALFSPEVSLWIIAVAIGAALTMALAPTIRNVRLAHPFFLIAALWSLGCTFEWLVNRGELPMRYVLAFAIGGAIFTLAVASFTWVESNHAEHLAAHAPSGSTEQQQEKPNGTNERPNISAPNGIANGGDNLGTQTVNNNYGSQLPAPRVLSEEKVDKLSTALKKTPGSVELTSFVDGDKEVSDLHKQLEKAFTDGDWSITKTTSTPGGFNVAGLPAMPDNVLICGAKDKDDKTVKAALSALQVVGLKCAFDPAFHSPFMPGPISGGVIPKTADLSIIIRKRTPVTVATQDE
jgi:hypothetical protein